MYSSERYGLGKPYVQRRFLSDGRLESKGIDGAVPTAIYTRTAGGTYETGSSDIYRYVTDGMRLFLQKVH